MSWKGRGKEEERGSLDRNFEEGMERKELGMEGEVGRWLEGEKERGSWDSEEEEKGREESSEIADFSSSDFLLVRGEVGGTEGGRELGPPSWPLCPFCWCLYLNLRMISEGYWATKRLQGSIEWVFR